MNKKRILLLITLFIAIILGIFGWYKMNDYSRVLKSNWEFSIPAKSRYSEVYEKDSGSSFHGDGIRYHVFSYKYEDYIEEMFVWINIDLETIFNRSYSEAATEWLDKIDVPEQYRPNYSNCVYWYNTKKDNSEILVFWDSDINYLYVVESFI